MDGVERLWFVAISAPDGSYKQLAGLSQAAQFVEVAVEVVGHECEGVIVVARAAERAAGVHADEQGKPRLARTRLGVAPRDGQRQEEGADHPGESRGASRVASPCPPRGHGFTFFGCICEGERNLGGSLTFFC